jgi:hypothetical protein
MRKGLSVREPNRGESPELTTGTGIRNHFTEARGPRAALQAIVAASFGPTWRTTCGVGTCPPQPSQPMPAARARQRALAFHFPPQHTPSGERAARGFPAAHPLRGLGSVRAHRGAALKRESPSADHHVRNRCTEARGPRTRVNDSGSVFRGDLANHVPASAHAHRNRRSPCPPRAPGPSPARAARPTLKPSDPRASPNGAPHPRAIDQECW